MDILPNHHELLQAETLTEKAYRALEEEIVTLRIPPGSVVSEAILSRRLGSNPYP
jgi:DNA-binding GntR family transcriptional regulator